MVKDKIMPIRISSGEYEQVKKMARQEGKTVSAFVLSRVWGEAPGDSAPTREPNPTPPTSKDFTYTQDETSQEDQPALAPRDVPAMRLFQKVNRRPPRSREEFEEFKKKMALV